MAPGTLRHVDPNRPRGPLYRAFARFSASRVGFWLSRHIGWKVDPVLMRLTRGRLGVGLVLPTALLETRGARSGELRRNVVIYFHDGERVIVIASQGGLPNHPAWFHNARANPDVTLNGLPFRVEIVDDESERTRLWALADRVFPPFATYRVRTAAVGRTIPILQLTPR